MFLCYAISMMYNDNTISSWRYYRSAHNDNEYLYVTNDVIYRCRSIKLQDRFEVK